MIIYPPFIADTIPAFTSSQIKIPFSQNPAVSWGELAGFSLIIKDYQSSKVRAQLSIDMNSVEYNSNTKQGELTFTIPTNIDEIDSGWSLQTTSYYKFQIGYVDEFNQDGKPVGELAYSTVSVGRCIGDEEPWVLDIFSGTKKLNANILNINSVRYQGHSRSSLLSEPIYNYRFYCINTNTNEIIQDTGFLLHDVDSDNITTVSNTAAADKNGNPIFLTDTERRNSIHDFTLEYELQTGERYALVYQITTVNGFVQQTSCPIIAGNSLPCDFPGELQVYQDGKAKDNGYVHIQLSTPRPYRGTFILERSSDLEHWEELTEFTITHISDMKNFAWSDWTVAQGEMYTYALRQKFGTFYSERICQKTVRVDFEDMFLSDGTKQLRIKFDPKVSSFKDTLQDQKTNTLGNRYPIFFRNGAVKYKEIPIAGLISYWMDSDEFFCSITDLGLSYDTSRSLDQWHDTVYPTHNLVDWNIAAERKFKLQVLDWLNSPTPKLFRSPAEGNYVVRLMNVSLTPNDTLGRMLHSFTSTASEIADSDIKTLKQKSLIHIPIKSDPPPQKTIYTLTLEWFEQDNPTETPKVFEGEGIEQINWYSIPNFADKLKIDGKEYINTTGIFTTPVGLEFNKIEVTKDMLINGSVSFYYTPDVTAYQGTDTFEEMVKNSEDILFSAPAGYTLREDLTTGILLEENDDGTTTETTIYKTYVMIVRRDINYSSTNPEDYKLTFVDELNNDETVIDCSDGQIRYYYNLNSHILYEKGLGLHVDIYARTQTVSASSGLGNFILDISKLA